LHERKTFGTVCERFALISRYYVFFRENKRQTRKNNWQYTYIGTRLTIYYSDGYYRYNHRTTTTKLFCIINYTTVIIWWSGDVLSLTVDNRRTFVRRWLKSGRDGFTRVVAHRIQCVNVYVTRVHNIMSVFVAKTYSFYDGFPGGKLVVTLSRSHGCAGAVASWKNKREP